jgi:hypothetical protein
MFDYIVGNPPYQYPKTQRSKSKKLYLDIFKRVIHLGDQTIFLAPNNSVIKSQHYSVTQEPIEFVEFNFEDYFPQIKQKICMFKTNSKLKIKNKSFYDYSLVGDKLFYEIYEKFRYLSSKRLHNKMFFRYSPPKTTGNFLVWSKRKEGIVERGYLNAKPPLHNDKKIIISLTKTHNPKNLFCDNRDFSNEFIFTKYRDTNQIKNIESFIYSDFFIQAVKSFKIISGDSFNKMLCYCPIFDDTKKYSSQDVRKFFEEFVLEKVD